MPVNKLPDCSSLSQKKREKLEMWNPTQKIFADSYKKQSLTREK
jgi:hypothetical protein